MKKLLSLTIAAMLPVLMLAQGWPSKYSGVMLQGFYWDSYSETRWPHLESQADELAEFFKLVWIPQSASCGGGTSMGYDDMYWFTNYNSSFGNESQLRSLIKTFNSVGIGTIADVVVNHRATMTNWVDFPTEVYNGVTYHLEPTDICANDDGGATKTWADANGYTLSSAKDTGEDWSGMRDLDHTSTNVQENVKAYVKMLLEDFGYAGVRYDMVKGYSPTYTGMYNSYANPTYSVGEYFDSNLTRLKNWIDGTKVDGVVQSAAFDFAFRETIRDAVNNSNWTYLGNTSKKGLNLETNYRRYAVTFIENHDTQIRSSTEQQDPIRYNIEAANAYLLSMPGTPCVFLKHWIDYKEPIKQMIYARQIAGVFNTSQTYNQANSTASNYYVQRTIGTNGTILAAMGSTAYEIPSTYVQVMSGTNYRLALSKTCESAWTDKPSGEYDAAFDVTMTAISATDNAQLIYTTDGSEPASGNGTVVSSGSSINISASTTLKVGLYINGSVSGVITRNYTIDNSVFEPYDVTIYLKDPTVSPNNWGEVRFYCWDSGNAQLCGDWPGTVITDTQVVNGETFYCKTFTITDKDYYLNFVFNQGSNAGQTVDVTYINKTSFFEISTQTNKYEVKDVTNEYAPYLDGGITGDVNGDGEVTIADVNAVIDLILAGAYSTAGDVNGDGEVTIADVNAVVDIILGNE